LLMFGWWSTKKNEQLNRIRKSSVTSPTVRFVQVIDRVRPILTDILVN
jgi:hypothetical protein